jgi:hypothetical protein
MIGYDSQSCDIVLGTGATVRDFVLIPVPPDTVPRGTVHVGTEGGTWQAIGNPHVVDDTLTIDNLVIAPGCSVFVSNRACIYVDGNLEIGQVDSSPVYISNGTLLCNGNGSLVVSKCHFNNCTIGNTIAGTSYSSIKMDSVAYDGDSIGIEARADTIVIRNCTFSFPTWGAAWIGNNIAIDNSIFTPDVKYESYSSVATFVTTYSIYHGVLYRAGSVADFGDTINHCNISIYENPYQIPRIQNSIIGRAYLCPLIDTLCGRSSCLIYRCASTVYISPLECNVFDSTAQPSYPIFGLLTNNQLNSNGDSCDTWFNLKCDPRFVDSSCFALQSASPALNAASDGTNIGVYQGAGVLVDHRGIIGRGDVAFCLSRRQEGVLCVRFTTMEASNVKIRLFDISGRDIAALVAGRYSEGTHTLSYDARNLSGGSYVVEFTAENVTMSKHFVVVK